MPNLASFISTQSPMSSYPGATDGLALQPGFGRHDHSTSGGPRHRKGQFFDKVSVARGGICVTGRQSASKVMNPMAV